MVLQCVVGQHCSEGWLVYVVIRISLYLKKKSVSSLLPVLHFLARLSGIVTFGKQLAAQNQVLKCAAVPSLKSDSLDAFEGF